MSITRQPGTKHPRTRQPKTSTLRKSPKRRRQPISFPEWFTVLNGCVPLVMLMLDAKNHHLGADPIRKALGITGAFTLAFLLGTLMVTPARLITGWNQLHRFRRPLGLMAFLYGVSHFAIFVGYDRVWDLQDAWREMTQRRYLQFGGAALLLMVPLALTSTPGMIRLLTMKRWKVLHRLVYVAAIAAVAHFWLQSKADIRLQLASVVILGVLLVYRVVRALMRAHRMPRVILRDH